MAETGTLAGALQPGDWIVSRETLVAKVLLVWALSSGVIRVRTHLTDRPSGNRNIVLDFAPDDRVSIVRVCGQ